MLLFTRPSVFSCSKKIPYPPRRIVRAVRLQAKPKRGPNCVMSVAVIESGRPAWLLGWMAFWNSA